MSEVLTPKVGDRVRLVRENGDEATITLERVAIGHASSATNTFAFSDGWSVAEVIQKALPPAGTFVKGVAFTAKGEERFVGRSSGSKSFPFSVVTETEIRGRLLAKHIKSWEVIDA